MSAQLSHKVASILKKIKVVSFRSDAQGFVPRGKASNKRGYYEKKGVSIISVVMDAPMSCTSALSGKLGMIDGVTAKCNTAKI